MSSVECLREFVNERLSAAAEEIFGVFKGIIVEYQEEIDRQRTQLEVFWKPEVKLHRIKLPQPHVCKEEEVLSDQHFCLQERNTRLDQDEPDPPQIKEEQEELCCSQGGEQLEPKQETFIFTPTCEEGDHSEDQLLDLCTDETQIVIQETSLGYISVKSTAVVEPSNDHQLLSHNSHQSDCINQKGEKRSLTLSKEPSPPSQKPFLCKQCGKYLKSKKILLLHVKKDHSVDHPYVCDTCGKGFIHESTFKNHKRAHSDEKSFLCKTCGKKFKFSRGLKAHMNLHTGEKPYSCIYCTRTFNVKSKWKFHTKFHTGEKVLHSCDTCGKNFRQLSEFKKHTIIHTGERPYSCVTCGKTFNRTSSLKSHIEIHTRKKPYSYKICERDFSESSNLILHTRSTHKGETSSMQLL